MPPDAIISLEGQTGFIEQTVVGLGVCLKEDWDYELGKRTPSNSGINPSDMGVIYEGDALLRDIFRMSVIKKFRNKNYRGFGKGILLLDIEHPLMTEDLLERLKEEILYWHEDPGVEDHGFFQEVYISVSPNSRNNFTMNYYRIYKDGTWSCEF